MSKALAVLALLSSLVTGCESRKQEQERIEAAQKKFDQALQESSADLDRKLRDKEIVLYSHRYGEQAGIDLLRCEHDPPQLEKNKAKCQRLETQLDKFIADRKAHPEW